MNEIVRRIGALASSWAENRTVTAGAVLLQGLTVGVLLYVTLVLPLVVTFMFAARLANGGPLAGLLLLTLFVAGVPASMVVGRRLVRRIGFGRSLAVLRSWVGLLIASVVGYFVLRIWISSPLLTWMLLLHLAYWSYRIATEGPPTRETSVYHARFAAENDVRDMMIDPDAKSAGDALLVGAQFGQVLGIQHGHGGRFELGHALVSAPTRSGKGRHLTANLLNWRESAVVLDLKGENYRATAGYRQELGRVLALDPRGLGHRYDPFAELRHSEEALLTAAKLLVEDRGDQDTAFSERAANGLLAALLAAKNENAATLPYLDALLAEGLDGFVARLAAYRDARIAKALTLFLGYRAERFDLDRALGDRYLASTWGILTTRVGQLLTGGILAMTGGSDFKARDLFDERATLYLIFPEAEGEATGKIFRLVTLALILGLIRAYDEAEIPPTRTVLLALDEVGRTPLPRLPDFLSTIAGRGMSALVYVQSLAQLAEAYGEKGAEVILDNCRTQIYYPTANVRTQQHVSKLGGTMEYEDVSVSEGVSEHPPSEQNWGGGASASQNVSRRLSRRELIMPEEVRTMHPDATWVFTANKPPIYAWRLDPAYVSKDARLLAEAVSPPRLESLQPPFVRLPPTSKSSSDRVARARGSN